MSEVEVQEFTPVIVKPRTFSEEDRVHLFSLVDRDGHEKKYYAYKTVPFRVTLKATKIYAEHGEQQAEAYCLTEVLGREGFAALCESDDLDEEQFAAICTYASKVVMSQGKAQQAKTSPSARGKKK